MIYTVKVTETLQRDVQVRAETERQAIEKINADWENATLILMPDDTQGIVTHVLETEAEWTEEQRNDPDWASYLKESVNKGIRSSWCKK